MYFGYPLCVADHFSQSVWKNFFKGFFEEYDEEYDEESASDFHPPRAQAAWNGDAASGPPGSPIPAGTEELLKRQI